MIYIILKISLVGFAFLCVSCGVEEQVVQSQRNSNAISNQIVTANQNANVQSSNANTAETKALDYFAHLKPEHREVLQNWLKTKNYLRPAIEEMDNSMFLEKYKDSFDGNMKFLRETVGINGYQYYSVGDMNRDGKVDFAVLLVDTRKQKDELDRFALAIFNAPFKSKHSPDYFEEGLLGITNSYIVFDLMIEKHLYLGKFESDVYCATYYPKGRTYYFKDCGE